MPRKWYLPVGIAGLGLTGLVYGFFGLLGAALWVAGVSLITYAVMTVRTP